jgi:peptide chain release factor subunit 1
MHLNEYFNRLGGYFTEIFLNQENLKGIIVGGPGPTKEDFLKGNYLHHELKEMILTTVDTGYTGPEGVKEVVNRSRSFLQKVRYMQERKVVQEFLQHLGEDDGLATYGEQEVLRQLKNVNVYKLLISQEVRRWYAKLVCSTCGFEEVRIVDFNEWEEFTDKVENLNCLQCEQGQYTIQGREDFIEKLVSLGQEADAEIEIISTHTEEGEMLYKSFGGVAAITKYRTY